MGWQVAFPSAQCRLVQAKSLQQNQHPLLETLTTPFSRLSRRRHVYGARACSVARWRCRTVRPSRQNQLHLRSHSEQPVARAGLRPDQVSHPAITPFSWIDTSCSTYRLSALPVGQQLPASPPIVPSRNYFCTRPALNLRQNPYRPLACATASHKLPNCSASSVT
jgi:hypothetical protein